MNVRTSRKAKRSGYAGRRGGIRLPYQQVRRVPRWMGQDSLEWVEQTGSEDLGGRMARKATAKLSVLGEFEC
jgi:hypothetical protein